MKKEIDFDPYFRSLSWREFLDSNSRGRRYSSLLDDDAPLWPFYESYHLDVVKSAGSKAVRRLDKTQVFIQQNNNPLIRNRKTHTEEVVLLARQIAYFLGLNVYLVEAIALTHDFGHTPFGHLGEIVISEISQREFLHAVMSVVIAQKIERRGQGLNLSWETLEGVLRHSRGKNGLKAEPGFALEYAVVMLADKIAYTFSDLNDAIRAGYFQETQLPKEFFILGANQRERMLNCLFALVQESSEKQTISFCDSEVAGQFESLRQWSYVNFYEALNYEEERIKAKNDLKRVYSFFNDWLVKYYHYDPLLALALLTDNEAMEIAKFADKPMLSDLKRLSDFSFMEILGRLPQDNKIDIFDPDLNVKEFSN